MSAAEPPIATTLPFPTPKRRRRPRLKKLRLLLILTGLAFLAVIATVFGMMMAVASDLPQLENLPQYRSAKNSMLVDDQGQQLGLLVSNQNRILVNFDQISGFMRDAIIAVEDKRFYTNNGVDIRGIARAFVSDLTKHGGTQGGSTITQQFVKVALQAEGHRTVFEKLREAALAYHLTRKWSKNKILTEYLNAIYYGNGAYGIESAARTYFAGDHPGCGTTGHPMCAKELTPAESAFIAGVVQNPSGYDPLADSGAAIDRRNLVLKDIYEQGYITDAIYREGLTESLPTPVQPNDSSTAPYFTSWVRQQLVDKYGPHQAFEGGLKVRTTLDSTLQQEAWNAVSSNLGGSATQLNAPGMPSAALVAIDNQTGGVRAMIGGPAQTGADFAAHPFNLATQGERQPGSSFKAFDLATALAQGISPSSIWTSAKRTWVFKTGEVFTVHNDEGSYLGPITLANATYNSDNTVFAQVGFKVKFTNIKDTAVKMGIRTPVSTNPAMAIGGLHTGVTVLDMAHAYETLAMDGNRIEGTLGSGVRPYDGAGGPVGILNVQQPGGKTIENKTVEHQVVSPTVVATENQLLEGVVKFGTGKAAQIPGVVVAGKTGTTDNYVDAWFVGFTPRLTVAVWVGYPNSAQPMKTQFQGGPVLGGTYPARIWRSFMVSALQTYQDRQNKVAADKAAQEAAKNGTTVPATTDTTLGTSTTPTDTQTTQGATSPTTTSSSGTTTPATPNTTTSTPPPAGGPTIGGGTTTPADQTQTPSDQTQTPTTPASTNVTGGAGPG